MNEFDYLAKAKNKMRDEKYHEVISLCDKALKLNEKLPDAYDFRGNANYELGEYDSALKDFSKAIEFEPDEADHYYDRSWAYINVSRYEDALLDINKALELKPDTSYYYYDKGRFEYDMDRYREAVADFTKGIELYPTPAKYICRGNCYMEIDKFDLAMADFNMALELDPESARAYYRRGILKKRTEQFKSAIEDFLQSVEIDPENYYALLETGWAKINLGENDALKYFDEVIKTEPSADNYYYRVLARQKILKRKNFLEKLSSVGKMEYESSADRVFNVNQAIDDIKDLNKAIALTPDDTDLYEMRVIRYEYLKDYKNAIEDYNFIIEKEPRKPFNYTNRAFCYERMGLYEEALTDCKKYVEINDGCADEILLILRGEANYKLGNYEAALLDLSLALTFDEDPETYYYRGLTNYKLKNYIKAYEDFKAAMAMDIEAEYDEKIPKLIEIFLNYKNNNDAPIGLNMLDAKQ